MGIGLIRLGRWMSLLPLYLIYRREILGLVDLFGRFCSIDQLGRYWIVSHNHSHVIEEEQGLTGSIYLRFRHGLKVQNLLKTDILPVKGRLQPLSGWWLVIWAPVIFIFKSVLPKLSLIYTILIHQRLRSIHARFLGRTHIRFRVRIRIHFRRYLHWFQALGYIDQEEGICIVQEGRDT
jgi:hypothetical protein